MTANEAKWIMSVQKALKGATIVGVRLMERAEMEMLGWYSRAVVLICEKDGKQFAVYPSADDEGNNAGAMFTTLPELQTIPVFR